MPWGSATVGHFASMRLGGHYKEEDVEHIRGADLTTAPLTNARSAGHP